MLVAASICPHPPLLVPGVCRAEPGWLAELREVCVSSVRRFAESGAERVVAVGGGEVAGRWGDPAGGHLHRFGVDASAGGPSAVLPLSLTVAAHLLDAAAWSGPREYSAVARGTGAEDCAALGSRLVDRPGRVALLVMGDGSAKRTTSAPGYLDPRAGGFDADVVAALSAPALDALLAIDSNVADELWVAGREAWQVLAGAAVEIAGSADSTAAVDVDGAAGAPEVTTCIRYAAAPRGVGYSVVEWSRRQPGQDSGGGVASGSSEGGGGADAGV